jgi:hypothetical protein
MSSIARWLLGSLASVLLLGAAAETAEAQSRAPVRWVVEPATSLVWWQIDPHMGHLWATTCPRDPSWEPGEGRSAGWITRNTKRHSVVAASAGMENTPLYPRGEVRPVCSRAMGGSFTVADPANWTGIQGFVTANPDSLITGQAMRDATARKVFETSAYPEMRFTVERLANVQAGDTLRATAHGTFELRGVSTPAQVPLKAWMEGNNLRVVGQFGMAANDLVDVYGMSRWKLGLGVGTWVWRSVFMGFDVILRPVDG